MCVGETGPTHPQLPPEHGDLALGLLLAQAPLDGVEAVVGGQRDVPAADGGADGAGQDVGLRVEADAHAVGVHHPQGAIVAQLVAVPDLVCRGRERAVRGSQDEAFCIPLPPTLSPSACCLFLKASLPLIKDPSIISPPLSLSRAPTGCRFSKLLIKTLSG